MTDTNLLEGKVIVVTGAGGGIGAEIAKLAAAKGAQVIVNDIGGAVDGSGDDSGPADTIVREIEAAGGKAIASYDSVATWDGAHAIIQTAIDSFGRIDGVVNNAGVLRDRMFHNLTQDDWEIVQSVNLSGCFFVARAAAPHFKAQSSGAFVHMTSTSGILGNLGQANYGAAKMGLAGLSKCIALDMERFAVRSNCIAPAAFTRMVGSMAASTEANRAVLERVKNMTPNKIAPLAVCLLSDAANDVTGQVFGVRNDEILLYSQPRPLRTIHNANGWTAESCIERVLPGLRSSFVPLEKASDILAWAPL